MAKPIELKLKAKITQLRYKPGKKAQSIKLPEYNFSSFDINASNSTGYINLPNSNRIAFSKWITPKRTRSYPFARIYDTYLFGGKVVTIIPIIKDEGLGEGKNKSNNDRINFITLSWMNLMNIYVILAWYSDAEKKNEFRITNQKFDNAFILTKLQEIIDYKQDAHHWNRHHFAQDFKNVFENAVKSYEEISQKYGVRMHSSQDHLDFLKKLLSDENPNLISLEKFAKVTLAKSLQAANRESLTKHKLEHLSKKTVKTIFEIENTLGGKYFLTADEVIFNKKDEVIIQESKNASDSKLPSLNDIKDGLFKLLLFSQIDSLSLNSLKLKFTDQLKLTGKIKSVIILPNSDEQLEKFIKTNSLSRTESKIMEYLNEEAKSNNIKIIIDNNED